jgi:membrane protein
VPVVAPDSVRADGLAGSPARRALERAISGAGGGPRLAAVVTPVARHRPVHLVRRTLSRAWADRVLGLSAETAFWQLLSLPPLFLALLGSLGYLSGALGADTVNGVERELLDAFARGFSPTVVDEVIAPTVSEVLRQGRADVISIGFLIAIWAGSSATATFVNTVTIAYGMRDLRGAVHSRLLALGLYLGSVVVGLALLPMLVLGPSVLLDLIPESARPDVARFVSEAYWPVVAGVLLIGLTTFYHLAVPKRLPWHRGVPGALFAMAVFLLGSMALRAYIGFVLGQGFTYGTLAAPILALLFFYVLALAVLMGAELNATIEQIWPSRPTWRQRRQAHRRTEAAAAAATGASQPAG